MIEFGKVSKHFGTQQVLDSVSFRINAGERVGIVGPNGTGKSTIFALIAGELDTDKGDVRVPRGCRLGHVHQQLAAVPGADCRLIDFAENALPALATIQEDIAAIEDGLPALDGDERAAALRDLGRLQTQFEDMDGYSLRSRAEATLGGLGFETDAFRRPFSALSGGWRMRAELARALVADPDVLLLDEPSNYLDVPAVEWLHRFLREFKGTLLLISHDRFLLNSLTTATLAIASGTVTRFHGNYDNYVREKRDRYDHLAAAQKNLQRKRERAERFVERFRAKNTKASLVKSKIKMLERMETVDVPREAQSPGQIRLLPPPHCGREVVRLEGTGFRYDDSRWILRNLDLRVERGDKTGLVGMNGTGKTTLLRLLAGQVRPGEGRRHLGHKVVVGYQSQEFAETMDPKTTVFDTVRRVAADTTDQYVRTLLGGFGFRGDAIEKPVAVLSGGEKIRLAFARLLVNPPSFLILDEPTTHLDIDARQALEAALREYDGTVFLVSHDIEFLRAVATSIIAMEPPGVRKYWGGYDYYKEKCATRETAGDVQPAAARNTAPSRKGDRRKRAERVQEFSRLSRDLKKQVDKAETRLAELELERGKLTEQLSSAHADYATVNRRLAEIQKDIAQASATWEEAALRLEELEQEFGRA